MGSRSCAPCHPKESSRHSASAHEHALRPASVSSATALFDRPVRERDGTEFRYNATPEGLNVQVTRRDQSAAAILEWIFGAGLLAFTPVGRVDGAYFEHRVSWYSASKRPGMTMGHPGSPTTPLGQVQSADTIFRCFNCHATGVLPGPDLSRIQPGVQCERCHGPGGSHVKTPTNQNVVRLTKLSPRALVALCADCHRMPDERTPVSQTPEIADPLSIRFAPVGLMASKCFQDSRSLSCVTCHDPHGGPRLASTDYENKCAGCHASASRSISGCPRETDTACLRCHMQKATPVPDLTFTDHRIRIYRTTLKKQ